MSTEEKTNQQSIKEQTKKANPAKNIKTVKATMKQEYTLDNMKCTEEPE